jgi:hypothetical protein
VGIEIRFTRAPVTEDAANLMEAACANKRILVSLKHVECPGFKSVWLGPFEQLTGAGYSLFAAIRYRIYERDLSRYNQRVQSVVVSEIEKMFTVAEAPDHSGIGDWLSGFYFNSAIERIVWAGERLLLTLATVQCPCGRATEARVGGEKPGWPSILAGSLSRLEHLWNDDHLAFEHCRAVREQFIYRDSAAKQREYRRADPLDKGKTLAMLRYAVNNRKHKVYRRGQVRDQESAGKGDNRTWSTSGADFQMDLVVEAFDLLARSYRELKNWNRIV